MRRISKSPRGLWHMLGLVSGERDARAERQSSWLNSLRGVQERLTGLSHPLQLIFAGFVCLHFSEQAYRAATDGALPEAGLERTPWFVAGLLLLFWLPFTVVGLQRLRRAWSRGRPQAAQPRERALLAVEPVALTFVLLFGSVHGALMAWPLVTGALDAADLRAELVANLSSTWRGLPIAGIVYLCAVGAGAFCAARLALSRLAVGRADLSRAIVGLTVLACLLGCYAVIRCGSGSLLP